MKRPCGHRAGDVERGLSFAWRLGESSTPRFLTAVVLTLLLFVGTALGLRLVVKDSSGTDGRRLASARILPWAQVEASGAAKVLEEGSPPSAMEANFRDPSGIDELLARLGLEEEPDEKVELRASPVVEPKPGWPELGTPPLSFPAPAREDFTVPEMAPGEASVVLIRGEGELATRFEPLEMEWSFENRPPKQNLRLSAGIDEAGRVIFAAAMRDQDRGFMTGIRKLLGGLRFETGEEIFGELTIEVREAGDE